MDASSKYLFLLIIIAVVAGWLYIMFHPSYTIENNLELNSRYYPAVTEESVKEQ